MDKKTIVDVLAIAGAAIIGSIGGKILARLIIKGVDAAFGINKQ